MRPPSAAALQVRRQSEVSSSSSFDSPFKGAGSSEGTTKIPSFAAYRSKSGQDTNKVFQYFMVGTMGAITALGAKATVQGGFLDAFQTQEVELATVVAIELQR